MPSLGLGLGFARGPVSFVPAAPILDTVSGAGAAYSTRRLRTAYSGSAIRVRRSSDNVEQDIGFSGNSLDTSALTSFIGSNSGFVVTWYDQSGNARHVSQSDTTRQPRIVNAGTIDTVASVPAPFFDGTTDVMFNSSPFLYAAGAMTAFFVCNNVNAGAVFFAEESSTSGNPAYRFSQNSTTGGRLAYTLRNDANTTIVNFVDITPASTFDGILKNIVVRDTGSQAQAFVNGTNGTNANYTRSGALTLDRFALGGRVSFFGSVAVSAGNIAEAIFFPSSVSNADLNAVNASQGSAYGLTINPI